MAQAAVATDSSSLAAFRTLASHTKDVHVKDILGEQKAKESSFALQNKWKVLPSGIGIKTQPVRQSLSVA